MYKITYGEMNKSSCMLYMLCSCLSLETPFGRLFTFNLDVIRMACIAGTDNAILKFGGSLRLGLQMALGQGFEASNRPFEARS